MALRLTVNNIFMSLKKSFIGLDQSFLVSGGLFV